MNGMRIAKFWRFSALAFLVLLVAACEDREERAEKHYTRAMGLLEQGDVTRGRIELRNALQLNGQLSPARYELGRLNEESGNLRNAINQYRLVAASDETHVEARLRLARLLGVGGAVEEARDRSAEAYALAPDQIEIITTYAALQTSMGAVEEGLALARRALDMDPDNVEANTVIISQAVREGDLAEALAETDRLIDRLPPDLGLHLMKLRILIGMDDTEAVEAHLHEAVEIFPEQRNLRQALAQIAIDRGDVDSALTQLRAIAAASPDDSDAQTDVARFLIANDRNAEAQEELRAVIAVTRRPRDAAELLILLAQIQARSGDVDEARGTLETAIDKYTDAPVPLGMLRVALARLEMETGNTAAAAPLVEAVLAADEENVDALSMRASLLLERDFPEDAVMDLRRALNRDPRNVPLMLLEAEAQLRLGNTALARDRLATASRVSERRPDVALRYASFLNGRGEPDAAETVLVESLERYPEDRAVLTALARLRVERGDVAGAQALEERLRGLNDGDQLADRLRAALLIQQGQTSQSVALLEQLLEQNDSGGGSLVALVGAYVQDGRADEAISLLDSLVTENPGNIAAQLLRADFHFGAGELAQAAERLREALETVPSAPEPHLALVRLYLATDRVAEAEAAARAGIDAVERDGNLRFLLTNILEREQRNDEAISEYEILYDQNPNSIVVANNLASLLAEFRADDPAALERASRVSRRLRDATNPHFQDTYGWIAFLVGDVAGALPYLEAAATGLPDNPLVRYHLGRVYAADGQLAPARANLEAALAIDPSFTKADSARETLSAIQEGG